MVIIAEPREIILREPEIERRFCMVEELLTTLDPEYAFRMARVIFVIPEAVSSLGRVTPEYTKAPVKSTPQEFVCPWR